MSKIKSLLWVGKLPKNGGGDEIYDKKIIYELEKIFTVKNLYITRQKFLRRIISFFSGTPHPRFNYRTREIEKKFKQESEYFENIVISWESFDFLINGLSKPSVMILHNVMSDALNEIFRENIASFLASRHSLFWEKIAYNNNCIKFVVLSRRDERILRIIAPESKIFIASPGAPRATPLTSEAFIPEICISGSYDWYPKKRDLKLFCRQYEKHEADLKFRHDLPFPKEKAYQRLVISSREIAENDFRDGLRVGLIVDTFLGGFKLKSTFYISNNCIVASMADIREEFLGAPHCDEFVRHVQSLDDVVSLIQEFSIKPSVPLIERWKEFKEYCMMKFSWASAAQEIARAIAYDPTEK